ncbi:MULTISPECIES: DMT family transporter [Actinomadura]|uniref:DMT family transporter n=1 Tax=Actinomadura yumaensis TaxID=111807 RepID=A0ABW2CZX0_9ACTN|nr:multidrug efflux SMR transporter [Actinomadura sp. J1-007]MWK36445.1 hypothetical protein [Actinomadura sp. J1-007]
MNWIVLGLAGLVEIAFSQSIKPTDNFTRPWPTLLCFALGGLSIYLLSVAMKTLPVGTSYAVFTGIGAVGAIALGMAVHRDPMTLGRALALTLIIGGLVLARATTPG